MNKFYCKTRNSYFILIPKPTDYIGLFFCQSCTSLKNLEISITCMLPYKQDLKFCCCYFFLFFIFPCMISNSHKEVNLVFPEPTVFIDVSSFQKLTLILQ